MDRKGELIIMDLSLNSEVFLALRASFDDMLKKVLQNMLEQKNDTAEINVKVKIKLEKSYINVTYEDQREVITPIFQHKVTSMLQVKEYFSSRLSIFMSAMSQSNEFCFQKSLLKSLSEANAPILPSVKIGVASL